MKITKEAKVGILAILSLAILFVGFKFLKGIDFLDPANTYYVVYDNIDGLTASNPVEINGYRVGRVGEIKLLQDGTKTRMLVSLEINDELEIYEGSEAMLKDSDFLGSKAIELNLQRRGRKVSIISTMASQPPMISDDLRRQADHFIDLMTLTSEVGRDPSERPVRRPEPAEVDEDDY